MTDRNRKNPRKWTITLLALITAVGLVWVFSTGAFLRGQSPGPLRSQASSVFTPSHSSVGEAIRHFFFLESEPQQPIAYTHKVHIEQGLECDFCHASVTKGPMATIPNITACMTCHEGVATDHPEIKKMAEYQSRGEDIPWQRVYGWTDEAHVRFNHAPHIRAEVGCETCHGNVKEMTVARKVVKHTMGFCVNCHEQRQASNDCMTCHY